LTSLSPACPYSLVQRVPVWSSTSCAHSVRQLPQEHDFRWTRQNR
jgi:hypothetical protein